MRLSHKGFIFCQNISKALIPCNYHFWAIKYISQSLRISLLDPLISVTGVIFSDCLTKARNFWSVRKTLHIVYDFWRFSAAVCTLLKGLTMDDAICSVSFRVLVICDFRAVTLSRKNLTSLAFCSKSSLFAQTAVRSSWSNAWLRAVIVSSASW